MKIIVISALVFMLALGGLGYIDYREHQDIKLLQLQMSALTQDVAGQHDSLVSHKKAILTLRSDQKKVIGIVMLLLQGAEAEPSPKSEQNSYYPKSETQLKAESTRTIQ